MISQVPKVPSMNAHHDDYNADLLVCLLLFDKQ